MSSHVAPALSRIIALTESRCSGGVFRKVFSQHLKAENFSNLAKRCLVISKNVYEGASNKSETCINLARVLQRSRNAFSLLCKNSQKRLLSNSAHASKTDKREDKIPSKKNEICLKDLKALMKTENKFLFDVREPSEVAQTGMLPTAINLPLSKLKSSLQMFDEEFKSEFKVQKPLPSMSHLVVFYGLASVKGASAVEIAHKMGYTKSRYYPGGYEEWKSNQTA